MKENFYHITDDLLVKYLLGEATPEEQEQVQQWIAASEENKKYYGHFKNILESSKRMAAVSTVNEEAAWQRFQKRIHNPEQKAVILKPLFMWWRVAAIIIVIAGAGLLTYNVFQKPMPDVVVQATAYIIADTLPDGSVVTLNKNSTISYPQKLKGDTRAIALKGEAFFNVTPNKNKPFIITVNDVTIRVVGTSFNVKSSNGNTEVIVETGLVQVTRNNKTIALKPQEKVAVTKEDTALVKQQVQDQLYNYYRSKTFVCDNTPLWKLVAVLNDAYNAHIVIERKGLENLPLTTTFNNESLDNILQIISTTFNIQVTEKGDNIILQ